MGDMKLSELRQVVGQRSRASQKRMICWRGLGDSPVTGELLFEEKANNEPRSSHRHD
jgi:hypothetical protein